MISIHNGFSFWRWSFNSLGNRLALKTPKSCAVLSVLCGCVKMCSAWSCSVWSAWHVNATKQRTKTRWRKRRCCRAQDYSCIFKALPDKSFDTRSLLISRALVTPLAGCGAQHEGSAESCIQQCRALEANPLGVKWMTVGPWAKGAHWAPTKAVESCVGLACDKLISCARRGGHITHHEYIISKCFIFIKVEDAFFVGIPIALYSFVVKNSVSGMLESRICASGRHAVSRKVLILNKVLHQRPSFESEQGLAREWRKPCITMGTLKIVIEPRGCNIYRPSNERTPSICFTPGFLAILCNSV